LRIIVLGFVRDSESEIWAGDRADKSRGRSRFPQGMTSKKANFSVGYKRLMGQLAEETGKSELGVGERLTALAEVLIGGAVVIGHNIYHALPNEVPILCLLLWCSLMVRRRSWSSVGLGTPASWKLVMGVAVCAAMALQLKDLVAEPLAHVFWHQPERVSSVLGAVEGHRLGPAVRSLAIVWTFAAFGEELAYRAFLMRRMADALNGTRLAYGVAILFSSVLFGFGHFYKGPTGVFDSTVSGIILAAAYMATRRNLWALILGHGLSDTFAVVATYFGW
jgi:uncharacterized protein